MTLSGDNLMRVKRSNRSALLYALHQNGAMSRKRLAQALSLTPAAITKITADLLQEVLQSFNVEARIINIARGPSVTRYEVQPAAGVKVSRITSLANDIALNFATEGVRMLNLVDGTAALVESPTGAFAPFEVHYAETFIVPAAAGRFILRPAYEGNRIMVLEAHVR